MQQSSCTTTEDTRPLTWTEWVQAQERESALFTSWRTEAQALEIPAPAGLKAARQRLHGLVCSGVLEVRTIWTKRPLPIFGPIYTCPPDGPAAPLTQIQQAQIERRAAEREQPIVSLRVYSAGIRTRRRFGTRRPIARQEPHHLAMAEVWNYLRHTPPYNTDFRNEVALPRAKRGEAQPDGAVVDPETGEIKQWVEYVSSSYPMKRIEKLHSTMRSIGYVCF